MGNSVCLCFQQNSNSSSSSSSSSSSVVKLVFWEGNIKILKGNHIIAGEIMFESPEKMVCHADSFFIGHRVPALAIDDQLLPGQTYFVLPIDIFECNFLTASSLAKLTSRSRNKLVAAAAGPMINLGGCRPFEYVKGENGRVLIKVEPEFIVRLINRGKGATTDHHDQSGHSNCNNAGNNIELLCSTPELKKHYEQLVGSREQIWSPKLETISEYKNIRFTPSRLIG